MRAYIYVRQSLDKSGEALGVQRQQEECERLCAARGWTATHTLVDNSVSASRGTRPAYQQLIDAIEARAVDVVVVYRLDRLLRRLTDLEALVELSERTGVQVASVQGDLDLTNSSGRLVARILASVARSEVETKGERQKLANRQKAAQGKPHGSRRPYGYEADLVTLREPEAAVLREMGSRVISGQSFKHIAYWLNEHGHTTSTGKPWYPITVRNMLQKARYGGLRVHEGVSYPAVWPAVFDADTWALLQATITLRARGGAQKELPLARKYLLTGVVFCGRCGLPLNGSTKRDHPGRPLRRTYYCRVQGDTTREAGCGGVVRNADALDWFVREQVIYRLDSPELASLLDQPGDANEMAALVDKRQAQVNKLDQLTDDYADGTLDKARYTRAVARVQAALAVVEREIEQQRLSRMNVALTAGQTVREAWNANGDDWRRNLLTLLIERIDVQPSIRKPFVNVDGKVMRFDAAAVHIRWRC